MKVNAQVDFHNDLYVTLLVHQSSRKFLAQFPGENFLSIDEDETHFGV